MSLTPISKTEYGSYLRNSTSTMRKVVTKLDRKGAILPVLLLEATVTGGRTYQAYKRDGFVEARERVTEESLGAVFWLFGATMAGKLFDKLGQKFLSIPENMPDVGVDSARTPFKNYIAGNKVFKHSGFSAVFFVKTEIIAYEIRSVSPCPGNFLGQMLHHSKKTII